MIYPINLGTTLFSRPSDLAPEILLRNRIFEKDPRNEQGQTALFLRPSIQELATIATGEFRGVFYPPAGFGGAFYVFIDDTVYRVVRTGPATFTSDVLMAGLATDELPSMDFRDEDLFFSDGAQLYLSDGVAAPTVVATPDDRAFIQVKFYSSYIVLRELGTQRLYWIAPGEVVIDDLDFAEAEGFTDFSTGLEVLGDKLLVFSFKSLEVWFATGDADAPMSRVQGRLYGTGAWPGTIAKAPNTDLCVFVTSTGHVRAVGSDTPLSSPGIEERIRQAIKSQIEISL